MPFDPSTAQPVDLGGFDPSTAQPADLHLAQRVLSMNQPNSQNQLPGSTAGGQADFTDETWRGFINSPWNVGGWTMADKKNNYDAAQVGTLWHLDQGRRQIEAATGRTATDPEVLAAHFVGGAYAGAALANPQGDAYQTYQSVAPGRADQAFSQNGRLLTKGMTNAQAMASAERYMAGAPEPTQQANLGAFDPSTARPMQVSPALTQEAPASQTAAPSGISVPDWLTPQPLPHGALPRVAQAAGEAFGTEPLGLSETSIKALRDAGIFPTPDGGLQPLRQVNEAVVRGISAVIDTLWRAGGAGFAAQQQAAIEVGDKLGLPTALSRDIAAMPEAFFGMIGGMHGDLPAPREPTPAAARPAAAPAEPAPEPEPATTPPPTAPTPPAPAPRGAIPQQTALTELERLATEGQPAQAARTPEQAAIQEEEQIARGAAPAPEEPPPPSAAAPPPVPDITPTNTDITPAAPRQGKTTTPFETVPKEPERLVNFLRRDQTYGTGINAVTIRGGIKDVGGDLSAIIGGPKGRPGLINNKTGRSWDDAATHAWENGYFPEHTEPPSINELQDAIRDDHAGTPRYSVNDADAVQAYQAARDVNSEIDQLAAAWGIETRGMTREQFYQAVSANMSAVEQAREIEERERNGVATYAQMDRLAREAIPDADPADIYGQSQARTLEDLEREAQQADAAPEMEQRAEGREQPGPPGAGAATGAPRGAAPEYRAGPGPPAPEGLPPAGIGLEAPKPPRAVPGQQDIWRGETPEPPPRAQAAPTIRNDVRQQDMFGTADAAVQAQAARDQAGRGALLPKGQQLPADEGLFARPEEPTGQLPLATPEPRRSTWNIGTDELARVPEHAPDMAHQTAANFVFDRGRETGHEHLAVVDNATGRVVQAGTRGKSNRIELDTDALRGLPQDAVTLHHNHPSEFEASDADMEATMFPGVSHVVGHTHDGDTFSIRAGPALVDARTNSATPLIAGMEKVRRAYDRAAKVAAGILEPLSLAGRITKEAADRAYAGLTARLLHAAGVIDYMTTRPLPEAVESALEERLRAEDLNDRRALTVQPGERFAGLYQPDEARPGAESPGRAAGAGEGAQEPGAERATGPPTEPQASLWERPPPEPLTDEDRVYLRARPPPQLGLTAGPQFDVLRDKKGLARLAAEVKAFISPTSLRGAKPTEAIVRRLASEQTRAYDQVMYKLRDYARAMDRLPRDEQIRATDNEETGQAHATPEIANAMGVLRGVLDEWMQKVQSLGRGYLANAIDNYMGHIWANYPEWKAGQLAQVNQAQALADAQARGIGKSPLRGSGNFLKQRFFPTQLEGIDAGLQPVTYNPIEMQAIKAREMIKFYYGTKMADEMEAQRIARWITPDEYRTAASKGLVPLDDRVFQPRLQGQANPAGFGSLEPGKWFAPEPAARIFNNYVSPGLAGRSAIYDLFRGLGNRLNMLQLGMSGFHATFVTLDTMISTAALGLQQIMRGDFGKGVGNLLIGSNPISALGKAMYQGSKLKNAWLDPMSATPEWRQLAQRWNEGGGQYHMPEIMRSNASGSFFKTWTDLKNPSSIFYEAAQMVKDANSPIEKAVMVPLRIADRLLFDTINEPIMGQLVPRAKAGVFAALAQDWQEAHPNATPEARAAAMMKFQESVDNRLGQLRYDNIFWNKTMKDIAFVMTRSVGWNLGTIRELGGGAVDAGKFFTDIARGRRPEFTARMAYSMAMPAIVGLYGAILTYLATGQPPQSSLDLFFPPTGGQNATTGEPERRMIPSYMKDVIEYTRAPAQTLLNKTQPLIGTAQELYRNQDYYGGVIASREAGPLAPQYGNYLLNQMIPFSWRGWDRLHAQNAPMGDQALAFFGIQPAPASIVHPERAEAYQQKQEAIGLRRRAKEPGRIQFFGEGP